MWRLMLQEVGLSLSKNKPEPTFTVAGNIYICTFSGGANSYMSLRGSKSRWRRTCSSTRPSLPYWYWMNEGEGVSLRISWGVSMRVEGGRRSFL